MKKLFIVCALSWSVVALPMTQQKFINGLFDTVIKLTGKKIMVNGQEQDFSVDVIKNIIKNAIKNGKFDLNTSKKSDSGNTLLHEVALVASLPTKIYSREYASRKDLQEIFEFLVREGARVDIPNKKKQTVWQIIYLELPGIKGWVAGKVLDRNARLQLFDIYDRIHPGFEDWLKKNVK